MSLSAVSSKFAGALDPWSVSSTSRASTASSTPSSRGSIWNGKPAPSNYLHKRLDVTPGDRFYTTPSHFHYNKEHVGSIGYCWPPIALAPDRWDGQVQIVSGDGSRSESKRRGHGHRRGTARQS